MNIGQIEIKEKVIKELMEQTESKSPVEAIDKSIGFTLLHDKDSIREALFERATKHA